VGDIVHIGDRIGARRGVRRATSARTWYEIGVALEVRDPSAAIHAYRRAIAGLPSLADAHNNLGRLLHDRGDVELAAACYQRALAIAPDVALYRYNLGVALEDRGSADEAVACYEEALARDPALADAHFNLARQLERRGRSSGDELALRRAVRHLARYRVLARSAQ
jgi:tetratricopeptide (TPR) repeat protein